MIESGCSTASRDISALPKRKNYGGRAYKFVCASLSARDGSGLCALRNPLQPNLLRVLTAKLGLLDEFPDWRLVELGLKAKAT